jgi:hypothetical protein
VRDTSLYEAPPAGARRHVRHIPCRIQKLARRIQKLARHGRKHTYGLRKRYRNLGWFLLLELLTSDGDPRGRLLRRNQEHGLAVARRFLRR